MRSTHLVRRAADELERNAIDSPRATAEILLAHVLGTDRAGLYGGAAAPTRAEELAFDVAVRRRCSGTPIQHITGDQPFRRLTLVVHPGVFIPRPETEMLVEAALGLLEATSRPVVVDVGTGTGAIALAIADERPDAVVLATDLSPPALALARRNANRLGLRIEVRRGDLLQPVRELAGRIDLVVSNPPYLRPDRLDELPAEVRSEPELALAGYVGLYERLGGEAAKALRPGGGIAVEIAQDRAKEVAAVMEGLFTDVLVLRDLAQRERFVLGRRA